MNFNPFRVLRNVRALALVFAALACVSLPASRALAQSAPQQPSLAVTRITQPIDETRLVTLKGNVHPLAQARFDHGAAPVSMPTGRIMLVLQGSQQQQTAKQQYLDALQNPGSPNYHKWLTPAQYGQLYGPTEQDVQAVTAWLQSQGFEVSKVAQARNVIEFSGSVGQVQNAFHTSIHNFVINGEQHYANTTDPQIPAALAPVVAGVASLNDFHPHPGARLGGAAHLDSATKTIKPDLTLQDNQGNNYLYVDPADAATIYDTPNTNLNRNYKSGTTYDGTGITIGIAGDSNITTADVGNYRTAFLNEPTPKLPNVIVDGNDPGINGDEIEALLDTQVSGALAPGATINFYTAADTDLQSGLFLAIYRALDDNQVSILNVSFGLCEASEGVAGNQQILAAWQQAAAQGISVTVSTGDSGSAACDNDNTETVAVNGLAVSGLASTPYDIAVGGTDFDVLQSTSTSFNQYVDTTTTTANTPPYYGTALSYIPEEPWNDSTTANTTIAANTPFKDSNGNTNIAAAGGGVSSAAVCNFAPDQNGNCPGTPLGYAKPAFQSSLTPNDKVRDLPDVSFLASDGAYGATWVVCLDPSISGVTGTDCQTTNGKITQSTTFDGVGGTSAASPAFAGMLALVAQSQAAQGKNSRLGQADTVLYALAKSNPAIFHDVITGNNSVYCSGGSQANCGSNSFMTGYQAGAGYDTASGLGSVDIAQLASNWNNAALASSSTNLTINGSTAAVTVQHGTSLAFSAGVAPSAATGTVTIQTTSTLPNNGAQIALALKSGTASGSYNGLPGGQYNVYGYYSGDSSNAASQSNNIAVNISPESSATALNINVYDPSTGSSYSGLSNSVPYGYYVFANAQPVCSACDVNGTITPDGLPTGTVNFLDNAKSLASAMINSQGIASYNNETLALGQHAISASYSGDPSFNPSTAAASGSSTFTIVQAATQTTVAASANTVTSVGTVTLQATVATDSLGAAPTGTITFYSGTTPIGSAVAVTGGVDPTTGLVNATASLPVTGSQLTSSSTSASNTPLPWGLAGGGAAMAFALFFAIPARRRSWRGLLGLMLFAVVVSAAMGCGSSSSGNVGPNSRGITAKYSGDTNYTSSSAATAISITVTQ